MGAWSRSGAARHAGAVAVALSVGALGCGGTSTTTFGDPPVPNEQGGAGGTGGSATTGGSTAMGGTGGAPGSGGDGATGGASTGGSGGAGAVSGGGTTGDAGGSAAAGRGGSASAGTGGTPSGAGTSGAGTAGTGGVDLSGMWAMFVWEDPVVVLLQQHDGVLTGRGCCAWSNDTSSSCCGTITGSVADRHAIFSFLPGEPTPLAAAYSADVFVSIDGKRLGGGFGVGNPTGGRMAWRRTNDGTRLVAGNPALTEAVKAREGVFDLTLVSGGVGGPFERDRGYTLALVTRGEEVYIYGDLGPFWGGEMEFDAASNTISVGPVPDTDPTFPTTLELAFTDGVLSQVTATYPDAPYVFVPTPAP